MDWAQEMETAMDCGDDRIDRDSASGNLDVLFVETEREASQGICTQ